MNTSQIIQIATPKLPTLAERAILVNLTLGIWDGYRYSEAATLDGFGSKDLGRANKALLKHSRLFKETKAAFNAIRTLTYDETVPWKDKGQRLLPSANYLEFTNKLSAAINAAKAKLALLDQSMPNEIAADKAHFDQSAHASGKPSLFDPKDYPADITKRFYAEVTFEPIPSSKDFRVDVSEEHRAALDAAVMNAQNKITEHLIAEIAKPMKQLAEHLAKPTDDVKRFHDSIVLNVEDTVQRLRKLNINNDANVDALLAEVSRQMKPYTVTPEVLKDSSTARAAAKAKLDNMLGALGL